MKSCISFATISVATALATTTHAECITPSVSVSGGEIRTQYDYLSPSPTVHRAALRVIGSSDCNTQGLAININPDGSDGSRGFGSGLVLRDGNETIIADLRVIPRSASAAVEMPSHGDSGDALSLSPTGDLSRDDLILTLQPGQSARPGRYSATIRVATSQDRSLPALNGGFPVKVVVEVKPVVALAAGSGTSLELGTIQPGATADRPVTFHAYSNTPYEIQLLSDNDWKLQRAGSAIGAIGYVPDMTGLGANHFGQFHPSAAPFQRHVLNVKVGDFQRARAGTYADWVTVRIRPITGG